MDHVQARRARAHAQGLHGPPRFPDAVAVVRHLVGVQAQDDGAAALMIRARTAGLTAADVASAIASGACVVTWSLRGTRHVHLAADVRPLLALVAERYTLPTRRAAVLGIDGAVGAAGVQALRGALLGGPLTRPEAKQVLEPAGVDPHGQAAVHVIRRAALEGVLCVLPGAEERYVLLDDVVPRTDRIDPEQVAAALARRHLAAAGPGTPEDLAAWAGVSLGAARRAWRALDGDVVEAAEPGRAAWVLRDREQEAHEAARQPGACRLLGGFDSLLLSYADRTLHVPADRVVDVNAGGGMIRAVALADGCVVGTWRMTTSSRGRQVRLRAFTDLGRHLARLSADAADVGRFLDGSPAPLTVDPAEPA